MVKDIYTNARTVHSTINFRKVYTTGKLQTCTIPIIEDLRSLLTSWRLHAVQNGKTLRSVSDNKVVVADIDRILNLDTLAYGCNWVRDYLKHSTEVEKSDRTLWDRVNPSIILI